MTDFELMGLALEEAAKAAALGEVPVGAVVARHGEVIATAHNTRETEKNALHHAELLAIDAACKALAVLLPAPPGGAARLFRVCLLAPLAEEGVFRGAVQRRAQPLGRGQAILLQAVLFALQHGSAAAMAYALVCGLGLGWLADRTGHLWPGMLLHSANNLLVLAMG